MGRRSKPTAYERRRARRAAPGAPSRMLCPTGKVRFAGERSALAALQRIAADAVEAVFRARQPCRVYECPRCDGWHLTSQQVAPPVWAD